MGMIACWLSVVLVSELLAFDTQVCAMESVVGKVSGTLPISVSYGRGSPIADGAELTKAQAAHAPTVSFSGLPDRLYTLVMVDPDAPSPDNPSMAQWLHWIVANIPGGNVPKGNIITPYAGPTPPRGTHRYISLLYEQPDGVQVPATQIEQRARFNVAKWAQQHGLPATPAAAVHFTTAAGH